MLKIAKQMLTFTGLVIAIVAFESISFATSSEILDVSKVVRFECAAGAPIAAGFVVESNQGPFLVMGHWPVVEPSDGTMVANFSLAYVVLPTNYEEILSYRGKVECTPDGLGQEKFMKFQNQNLEQSTRAMNSKVLPKPETLNEKLMGVYTLTEYFKSQSAFFENPPQILSIEIDSNGSFQVIR